MSERKYLGIVPIHGVTKVVEAEDLVEIKQAVNEALARPRIDYPHHDFDADVRIYNVRPLHRKERRVWERINGK